LKKRGKSRQNHGLQFIARYAHSKGHYFTVSVTNYHSHAAPFRITSQRIKILPDEKIQWKSSINRSL